MDCPVCLEIIEDGEAKAVECAHVFHRVCIDEWLKTAVACPMCRHVLRADDSPSERWLSAIRWPAGVVADVVPADNTPANINHRQMDWTRLTEIGRDGGVFTGGVVAIRPTSDAWEVQIDIGGLRFFTINNVTNHVLAGIYQEHLVGWNGTPQNVHVLCYPGSLFDSFVSMRAPYHEARVHVTSGDVSLFIDPHSPLTVERWPVERICTWFPLLADISRYRYPDLYRMSDVYVRAHVFPDDAFVCVAMDNGTSFLCDLRPMPSLGDEWRRATISNTEVRPGRCPPESVVRSNDVHRIIVEFPHLSVLSLSFNMIHSYIGTRSLRWCW